MPKINPRMSSRGRKPFSITRSIQRLLFHSWCKMCRSVREDWCSNKGLSNSCMPARHAGHAIHWRWWQWIRHAAACGSNSKQYCCLPSHSSWVVVLCVTDNVSAKNWTMHTSKKSIIWRALARFFCGLMIGSDVGINAKWIATETNKIADAISRLKKTHTSTSFCYDFSKLKQDHADLKHCHFYHPSQELLSLIWKTVLTRKSPDLDSVQALKLSGLGRLST